MYVTFPLLKETVPFCALTAPTAVIVSAWHGGLRPAVIATTLSTLILAVIYHYQVPGPADDLVLRLGMFVLVGLIAGYLSHQCQQAIEPAKQ